MSNRTVRFRASKAGPSPEEAMPSRELYLVSEVVRRAMLDLNSSNVKERAKAAEWVYDEPDYEEPYAFAWCCEQLSGLNGDGKDLYKKLKKAGVELLLGQRGLICSGANRRGL